ncbi:putative 26S proteasome regulatory subunit rpn9 [Psilocybe cubensis]|uniref:PCI domain-containing protein n=2 Tax=Psilocybe cubensis TaxID=181762 RepID=A0A8H7XTA8_PSICU|nr:putative 26S proteasome regulatory subunit rpn9 [Psilocybe cubensis]KAH9476676.1 putative 26S proteasome regulatory subunit rpn9 [Psilocybe cubensis]
MAQPTAAQPPKLVLEDFISGALAHTPAELHPFFESFKTLYTRKLWHQLTLKLFEFFDHPSSGPFRQRVFELFVRDFESKLNQLRLAEMAVKVAGVIDAPQNFLTALLSRIDKETAPEAHVILLTAIAKAKLLFGDQQGTKTDIDAAQKILDSLDSVENSVNAAYYRVAADYFKMKGDFASYYKNSLLYLACVDIEKDMSPQERLERAHDLSLSALLADTIYNFGELLQHPILDSLDGTNHAWLKKLLFTFNEGSIGKYEALVPLFASKPPLAQNIAFLQQKICLMALIESAFRRQGNNRTMSFKTIAEETHLPIEDVEFLVMRALSLKLIKGSIDEVDQKVLITWVQPRVLSREQIAGLSNRIGEWVDKLNKVATRLASEVPQTA